MSSFDISLVGTVFLRASHFLARNETVRNVYKKLFPLSAGRGVGGGRGTGPCPPWAPKAPFAIVRRPPIANVFTGKM